MYVHRYITLLVSEEEEGEGRERRREGKRKSGGRR